MLGTPAHPASRLTTKLTFRFSRAILHDENIYTDPESFELERYLDPERELLFPNATFGFGRRICPGRFMAQALLWISIARILSVFDIRHAVDGTGRRVEVNEEYTSEGIT